ncbi:hypothetical protein TNCV_619641 [Trichonephila clavipes]|nr:hypothetical protein TNCV_619641 [Trichonephila clavipes]
MILGVVGYLNYKNKMMETLKAVTRVTTSATLSPVVTNLEKKILHLKFTMRFEMNYCVIILEKEEPFEKKFRRAHKKSQSRSGIFLCVDTDKETKTFICLFPAMYLASGTLPERHFYNVEMCHVCL